MDREDMKKERHPHIQKPVTFEFLNNIIWKRLYADTVPANNEYAAGTVPANKKYAAGTPNQVWLVVSL